MTMPVTLMAFANQRTMKENAAAFKELYEADVSPTLVSKVTDAVIEQVVEWQHRPLDGVYPIVYLDCIALKVRRDIRVINKSVSLVLGINIEGQKELPDKWQAENEGAKFRLNVLTELKNRGRTISSSPVMTDRKASRMPSTRCIRKPGASCESCIWFATACGSSPERTTRPRDLKASGSATGTGCVVRCMGQSLPIDKSKLSGKPG